jgi:glucosamine 6-phosphate synthetase-like amidotransferase/phosphosugar isomerase protein
VLTHNGHINNDKELFKQLGVPRVAQVDSEAVAALVAFSKVKPWEFLTEIYGTAALAWLSANDSRTLHLARVNSSPLWLGQADTGSLFYGSTQETVENAAIMSDTELDWIYEAQEGEYFRVRDGRIEEYQTFTPSRRNSYWYDYPATTSKTTKNEQEWTDELDYFGAYNQHRARKYANYYANYKGDFDF